MYRSEKTSMSPFTSVILEFAQTSKNNVEKKLIVEFVDVSSKVDNKLDQRKFIILYSLFLNKKFFHEKISYFFIEFKKFFISLDNN